eukprot:c28184_g1_i1 orf=39-209(+)
MSNLSPCILMSTNYIYRWNIKYLQSRKPHFLLKDIKKCPMCGSSHAAQKKKGSYVQ